MKYLAEFLTKNHVVVVMMFFVTVISMFIGFLLSWDVLYRDYLSKSVSMPAWLIIISIAFFFVGAAVISSRKKKPNFSEFVLVEGKDFGVERVVASGRKFSNCKFDGTEVIIDGELPVAFEHCRFKDHRFTFDGAAALTVGLLSSMYQDPAFRPAVDETIKNIKLGEIPISKSPSALSL